MICYNLNFLGFRFLQVRQLVGATLLAEEDDRPELDEGEFYTRDLVGMKVLLKVYICGLLLLMIC